MKKVVICHVRRSAVLGILGAGLCVACGGAKESAPPRSPAAEPPTYPASQQKSAEAAPQPGAAPGATQGAYPSAPAPTSPEAAWSDMSHAQMELDAAPGDCTRACRALRSMDRSAGRVCTIADDRSRCTAAKDSVLRARAKVRASCNQCPDGTSVDADAPIPQDR
jgi:hypothetical protein